MFVLITLTVHLSLSRLKKPFEKQVLSYFPKRLLFVDGANNGRVSISETEIAELKLLHRLLKKKREADRVKAVYMLGAGYDIHAVAYETIKKKNLCKTAKIIFPAVAKMKK